MTVTPENLRELVERLDKMSTKPTRHDYDIGDFWNVADECSAALLSAISRIEQVRAETIEECAKVCDAVAVEAWKAYKTGNSLRRADSRTEGISDGAEMGAKAIRALSAQSNYAATQEIPAQASGFVRGPSSETPVVAAPEAQTKTPLTDAALQQSVSTLGWTNFTP